MRDLIDLHHGKYARMVLLFVLLLLTSQPVNVVATALYADSTLPGRGERDHYPMVESFLPTGQHLLSRTYVDSMMHIASADRDSHLSASIRIYYALLGDARLLGYGNGMAKALGGLSACYNLSGDKDKSIYFARLALQYCENNPKGKELKVNNYLLLSQSYFFKGRYDSSAYYRYAALDHVGSDPKVQMRVYCSLMDFWLNLNEDVQHSPHVQEVFQHIRELELGAKERKDTSSLMYLYYYKAGYYTNIQQNDSALYFLFTCMQLGAAGKMSLVMKEGLMVNIALTYIENKDPEKAIYWLEKANAKQHGYFDRQQLMAQLAMGEAYMLQRKYQQAINMLAPALQDATDHHIAHAMVAHGHNLIADAFDATGQYYKSSLNRKLYTTMRDSLIKVEKLQIGYDLEMKYRIADKNKEIAEKQLAITRNENRIRTKNMLIGGFSIGLIGISLLTFLFYRNSRQKQILQLEKFRNLRQEMRINNLQAMIAGEEKERSRIARDLHDGMGGMLGTIRTRLSAIFRKHTVMDVTEDFAEVLLLLEEASSELRKTAHNLMPEILLQEGLNTATSLFCERIRKGHVLNISFESYGNLPPLPADFELTLYRIIQELVNNILKHAGASQAIVQITAYNNQLCITVEDNGNGMPAHTARVDGMGLKTIRDRVQSLNGDLHIDSKPGVGTSIHIEFTILQNTTRHAYNTSDC